MKPTCCHGGAGRSGRIGVSRQGIDAEIVACRQRGMNRYEVHATLREQRDTLPFGLDHLPGVQSAIGLNRRTAGDA